MHRDLILLTKEVKYLQIQVHSIRRAVTAAVKADLDCKDGNATQALSPIGLQGDKLNIFLPIVLLITSRTLSDQNN